LAALLADEKVTSFFIEPGCPWQNGYIESFHGKLRDELLNRESFLSLREAQIRLDRHRLWYNQERPHSALAFLTPETFRKIWEAKKADTEAKW
jgi:putative transposase